MIEDDLTLCFITHRQDQSFHVYQQVILNAIQGGVTSVQLRDKNASLVELHAMALALKSLLTPLNIPLIINDHADIAHAVDAAGVHLGQTDGLPALARAMLGPTKRIGLSIETFDDLARANSLTCIDYLAASAVFPSQTKINCATIWGLDGLRKISKASKYPVVAIGGIELNNIKETMACGVAGVAVVGAIHGASCPKQAAAALMHAIRETRNV